MKKLSLFSVFMACSCFGRANTAMTKIRNPYKWVWSEDEGEISGMYRFFLDINDDQRPDLFLGANSLRGNGGGPVHVFIATESGGYLDAGTIDFQVIEMLPAIHNGLHDLKTYGHISAAKGGLSTYSFDGKEYKLLSNQTISADEYEKRIHPTKVKEERSGQKLLWKP